MNRRHFFKLTAAAALAVPLAALPTTTAAFPPDNMAMARQYAELLKSGTVTWTDHCRISSKPRDSFRSVPLENRGTNLDWDEIDGQHAQFQPLTPKPNSAVVLPGKPVIDIDGKWGYVSYKVAYVTGSVFKDVPA